MLWGVAEDHSSNPLKIGLAELKCRGAKFVSVNLVRTGYSAIADEWLPICPGTDGLLALALVHVLLKRGLIDWEFLIKYTNAPWLVVQTPGIVATGLRAREVRATSGVWIRTCSAARMPSCPGSLRRCSQRSTCPTAGAPRRCSRS
jgi:anaerobic selenocysteine-containing dehydrogenase